MTKRQTPLVLETIGDLPKEPITSIFDFKEKGEYGQVVYSGLQLEKIGDFPTNTKFTVKDFEEEGVWEERAE